MEIHCSRKSLSRKSSSLSRSPTVRSSIQSLSVLDESDPLPDEQKIHEPKSKFSLKCLFSRCRISLIVFFLFLFFLFFFYHGKQLFFITILFLIFFVVSYPFICGSSKHKESSSVFSQADPVVWTIGTDETEKSTKLMKYVKEGVKVYSNGDIYEGEFDNGECDGSGVYNYFVDGKYEGDWVNGKYDGHGIEAVTGEGRYWGQYRLGLRQGFGVYLFDSGNSYSGQWVNAMSHGVGLQNCSDGSSYVGEFKHGARHGLGCYNFRNGDRYAGEYFRDQIHGFGVYHFANGHCYEGSWHEGQKQGFGMYTFNNGESICGEWDKGMLKTPCPPSKDSVLRAVEASRKVANNAIQVPRVEDEVRKAILAACKAATAARVAAIKAVQSRIYCKC